jgi:hypothetical protein
VLQAPAHGLARTRCDAPRRRTALMLVLMMGLHSLLEYPLWYAYFLLPTAWPGASRWRPRSARALPAAAGRAPPASCCCCWPLFA